MRGHIEEFLARSGVTGAVVVGRGGMVRSGMSAESAGPRGVRAVRAWDATACDIPRSRKGTPSRCATCGPTTLPPAP